MGLNEQRVGIWRLSLEQIEATVADHLGHGRVPGNQPEPCFSRQISMYLAKHVGGWSTPRIGRFYNGRHHTTVLHSIQKVELLRRRDAGVDALLDVLNAALSSDATGGAKANSPAWPTPFLDAIAERVIERLGPNLRPWSIVAPNSETES